MPIISDYLTCAYTRYIIPLKSGCFSDMILHEDTLILFNLNSSEILRFNAFFYGYFYDRKIANYSFWLTFGSKKNINILFPFFYSDLNNSKYFKSLKPVNWFFLNYLSKNSFLYNNFSFINNISNLNLNYNNFLSLPLQFSYNVLKLSSIRFKFDPIIDINPFSEIDYTISTQLGSLFYDSTLLAIANRLFIQYSFFIFSNEDSKIVSPFYFFRFYFFTNYFKRCFDFFIVNYLWYNNINYNFYISILSIYRNFILNILKKNLIYKFTKFNSQIFLIYKFYFYISFYFILLKRNYFIYKWFISNFSFKSFINLYQLLVDNKLNFVQKFNLFIMNSKKKTKKNLKIFFNFYNKIYNKSYINLKLSLLFFKNFLNFLNINFYRFSAITYGFFNLSNAFKCPENKFVSEISRWLFFFTKEILYLKNGLNFISNKCFFLKNYIFKKEYNFIFNLYSRKDFLFRVYYNRFFLDRFYSFFFWNGNYKYRIERKYNSITYINFVKKFKFFWNHFDIFPKIKSFFILFINKFMLLILRKNVGFSNSIFSSVSTIYNFLISYFCSINVFVKKNIEIERLIPKSFNIYDNLFFNYYYLLKNLKTNLFFLQFLIKI